jgi:hypothetical protein
MEGGEVQKRRVEALGVADPLQHGGLEVVIQHDPGTAVEKVEGVLMPLHK